MTEPRPPTREVYETGIQLPGSTIAVITHESEGMVPVRRAELRHWASEVKVIAANPLEYANAWATTMFGVGVAALLGLLAVIASRTKTSHPPEWIYIVLGAVGSAALGIAAFCRWVDGKQRDAHARRADALCGQIKQAEDRAPQPAVVQRGDHPEVAGSNPA